MLRRVPVTVLLYWSYRSGATALMALLSSRVLEKSDRRTLWQPTSSYARTGATGGGVVKNPEAGSLSLEQRSCLISPDREKILRDILQDIVLNTAPGERTTLSEMLVQIINESVEQNADSVYQTMTDSLL